VGLRIIHDEVEFVEDFFFVTTSISMNKAYIFNEKLNNVKFDQNFRINH
jgi:hypothetical protein